MMKRLLVVSVICAGVLMTALMAGCATGGACTAEMEEAGVAKYVEKEHNGRIYVLGSEKGIASFKETGHIPYTKTIIGAGPNGETVVVEVDKKNDGFAEALWAAYQSKHNKM